MDADEEGTSNPHWVAFASATKGYLSRYEYNTLWIIDPSAESEEDFKTGEIDLSAYADSDEVVEMSKMAVVDGKLFVILQRMDRSDAWNWLPSNTAYLLVIDTGTDEIVDADTDAPGVQAVELTVRNPVDIRYAAETGMLYVLGVGKYPGFDTPAEYTGGIEAVDPATYATTLIVDDDDGEGTAAYGGNINAMAIASSTKGYLVVYEAWGDTSVRTFDPGTGAVGDVIETLAHKDIQGLAVDDGGFLWVLDASFAAPGVLVYDTTTDTQVGDLIDLGGLSPGAITFVDIDPGTELSN
jgi:hypothetical protein